MSILKQNYIIIIRIMAMLYNMGVKWCHNLSVILMTNVNVQIEHYYFQLLFNTNCFLSRVSKQPSITNIKLKL